jgi:maltose/moltooligosaccharide transporter
MPPELRKLAVVYLFQWYGMVCYWQFVALSIGKSVFPATQQGKEDAVAWTGLVNGWYNIITFSVAFALVAFARRRGAKVVHCVCLLLAAAGLTVFPFIDNKFLLFIPIIGLGIAWASIMGVPYIMAVRMIPSTRYGVYMGIINMMIVIPMLIQSVTFGWVYEQVLGANPNNAIVFAGVLLGLAAVTMLWIKEPPIIRDVDDVTHMPTAAPTERPLP